LLKESGHLTWSTPEDDEETETDSFLCGRNPRPQERQINEMEEAAITVESGSQPSSKDVTVFGCARKFCTIYGKDVFFRSVLAHRSSNKECSYIINHCFRGRIYFGKILYFLRYLQNGISTESAVVEWIGEAQKCVDSNCYFVETATPLGVVPSRLILVHNMNPPLVRAWEHSILWVPRLSCSQPSL